MISFKNFLKEQQSLLEGGNMSHEGHVAEPFDNDNRVRHQDDVKEFLHDVHNEHEKENPGEHIYGHGAKALHTGSAFSGSTKDYMDHKTSTDRLKKAKPKGAGDIDTQVDKKHFSSLKKTLAPGRKFGKFTVVKMHYGSEHNALVKHNETGEHHQIDFEPAEYKDHEPSHFDRFSHSANLEDTEQAGAKGVHHKLLLNALGGDKHKFSSLHGLGVRKEDKKANPEWDKDTHSITKKLFGDKAPESNLHHFRGLVENIKNHRHPSEHQAIYDRFKAATTRVGNTDHARPLAYMREHLGVKD